MDKESEQNLYEIHNPNPLMAAYKVVEIVESSQGKILKVAQLTVAEALIFN